MAATLLMFVLAAATPAGGDFHPPPPPRLPSYREVVAHPEQAADGWLAVPPPTLPPAAQAPVAASAPESASDEPIADEPVAAARSRWASDEGRAPMLGVQVHAGLPDGVGASLVLRPWRALRLHVGGLTNTMNSGLTGGVTLSPFATVLAPTLSAEAGFFGRGDLTPALRWASASPLPEGELASGSYRFYSAQLGLEIGAPDRFVFYLRAGLSRVEAALDVEPREVGSGETAARLEPGQMTVSLTMPSIKAGFTLYL